MKEKVPTILAGRLDFRRR